MAMHLFSRPLVSGFRLRARSRPQAGAVEPAEAVRTMANVSPLRSRRRARQEAAALRVPHWFDADSPTGTSAEQANAHLADAAIRE